MSENECSPLIPVVNSTESSSISSFTTSEQLRECFKPRCRVRRVTNKGAILVTVSTDFGIFLLFLFRIKGVQ